MKHFNGKVAAITGAGSGIGRALALELARRGCHLALSDIDEASLAETVVLCEGHGVKVTSCPVDVANRDAVFAWAEDVASEHGKVNLVVNNAGVSLGYDFQAMSYDDFEWLMGIKSRAVIPGGVCEFDQPTYHYWLHQSTDARSAALEGWIKPLLPLRGGLDIVLRLLRASGRPERKVAENGAFQMMLGGSNAQMVRVLLKEGVAFVPEISANKYALNIRFTCPDYDHRPRHAETSVEFEMIFCNL